MYVRLAFAVAAHLEPEILVIDEVLAVGDAEFQKKCLGKMKDVAGQGRTVLFVSHNMTAVKTLCSRLLYLKHGTQKFTGDVSEGIALYLGTNSGTSNKSLYFDTGEFDNAHFALKSIEVQSKNEDTSLITMLDEFCLKVSMDKKAKESQLDITCHITDAEGNVLLISSSAFHNFDTRDKTGILTYTCNFPANFFNEGEYGVNILFVEDHKRVVEQANGYISISVLPGTNELGKWMGKSKGFFRLTNNTWEITGN